MSVASLSSWAFRLTVILSVASMAGIILYFTPLPDLYFASCDRPCHELDWPMICRFRLILEPHHSMGGWCGDCPRNLSDCVKQGCVLADGLPRKLLTANRQLPGPSIQVCENDILVVDVVNRLPGQSVTVHWRGQKQTESPYMDGVPMVTQCPISSYTTFQYKFRASQAGTHLWQAHTGNELLDGLFGALIVKKPERMEEQKKYYDVDDPSHVLVLSEWSASSTLDKSNDDTKILVNGIAFINEMAVPKLLVEPGLKYRVRLAHAGGRCPFYISVHEHVLQIISLDGKPIVPIHTNVIHISEGERADFVLDASKKPDTYFIKVKSNCSSTVGVAKIVYNFTTSDLQTSAAESHLDSAIKANIVSTLMTEDCLNDLLVICPTEIESIFKLPKALASEVDVKLYLPFDYIPLTSGALVSGDISDLVPRLNNVTFIFPPSPLISQKSDLNHQDIFCIDQTRPSYCQLNPICECTHIVDIPLHSTVEIILINNDTFTDQAHVFHLHGNSFYLIGISDEEIAWKKSLQEIKNIDANGLLMKRNLERPIIKDTVTVPKQRAIALRFLADSAGYWLLHDQSAAQWSRGLDLVLRVGKESDLPPLPEKFPKCGSWVGPQFFLI
ncbi:uncharacterized protein isoform X2 [Rhodnius prolixus]|uniref:uncharacterized protein isoform X2 n=1 Tax=Rhodnius prolixus TaxID=13249 RepID=UPI003D18C419